MRRFLFVVCTVFAAAFAVSLSTLSAEAQSADQYEPLEGSEAPQQASETSAPDPPPGERGGGFVSQGSIAGGESPQARAAQKDLAEEERLPDYSQVVDNTSEGDFRASGWKVRRGDGSSHGGSYASTDSGTKPARFEVKIPSNNDYSVYAWWPAAGNSAASRIGVQAASGTKWSEVDQRVDGGMWVKVGTYAMKKGQRFVQVSPKSDGEGQVVADAVAVVRGETVAPPEEPTASTSGERATTMDTKAARFTGNQVVSWARRHIGDRYRYATCTRTLKSCTCLTKMSVLPFGHRMGMTEAGQWRYAGSVRIAKSQLRPGDEVFFKEGGSRYITHVGIYSGNGRIVHASSYWGRVVEKEMKYISGYFGAKRFKRG